MRRASRCTPAGTEATRFPPAPVVPSPGRQGPLSRGVAARGRKRRVAAEAACGRRGTARAVRGARGRRPRAAGSPRIDARTAARGVPGQSAFGAPGERLGAGPGESAARARPCVSSRGTGGGVPCAPRAGPGPSGRTSVLCSTAAHRRWIDAQAAARGFDAADEAEARASAGITATASGRGGRGRGAGDRTGAGPGRPAGPGVRGPAAVGAARGRVPLQRVPRDRHLGALRVPDRPRARVLLPVGPPPFPAGRRGARADRTHRREVNHPPC